MDPDGFAWRETVVHGVTNSANGVAGKTTKEIKVLDEYSQGVLTETYVFTGGTNYERIAWTVSAFDDFYHPIHVYRSDGTQEDGSWGSNCCGKESEKDATGIEKTHGYDLLNRLISTTKKGANSPTDDFKTEYTLDAADRRLTGKISGGSLALMTASNTYDLASRLTASVDSLGLTSSYQYQNGGRIATVIRPGNATNTTENYLDGKAKSVTGNAQTPQYFDHGVNSDGTRWTVACSGPAGNNSPAWTKTTIDLLGRTVREERPGFAGTTVTNAFFYSNKGQLVKAATPGSADTLYVYDELGNQIRSGLDVNANGILDLASMDRISESETSFEKAGSDWFRVNVSRLYAGDNSSVPTTNSIQKTLLTGLGSSSALGLLSSVVCSLDIRGNQTVSQTAVDRATKTVTQTVSYPDSTNSAVSITVNGLLASSSSRSVPSVATYFYDALERPTGVTDPRTGTSTTHYNDKGQVDWTHDPVTNFTWFAYDPDTGRQMETTNSLGNATFTQFDPRGNVLGTFGATYPLLCDFDEFNRMVAMYTLRTNLTASDYSGFRSQVSSFDKTQWLYDEATGLLTNKLYADGNGPAYSYTPDGKLASRTWARGIVTAYSYEPASGSMTNIAYSDGTPSVSFTLDRLGRQVTVTDATGTRNFTYNDQLQLAAETNVIAVINRQYDSLGRSSGFYVGPDLASAPYSVQYGFDSVGRFTSLSSVISPLSSNFWAYSYLPHSDLLSGYSAQVSGLSLQVSRSYEDHRNLLTQVKNMAGTNLISQFDYQNDALGRRTQRLDSLFPSLPSVQTNLFSYNPRSELTNALMGANAFGYQFDPIGNRQTSIENSLQNFYTANQLNQYVRITNGGMRTLSYDLDGNLTNDGVFAYTWDAESRLTSVMSNGSVLAVFKYDYMSRRYQEVSGSTTNTFLWDGWAPVCHITGTADQIITNFFVYGLDLSGTLGGAGWIGGLLACRGPPGTNWLYLADANGNVTEILDASSPTNILAHYEYDPYGNLTACSGPEAMNNHYRCSSKYWENGFKLGYWGYRWSNGDRWISRDPIGEMLSRNLYGFLDSSPINNVDFLGLVNSEFKEVEGTINWAGQHVGHAYAQGCTCKKKWFTSCTYYAKCELKVTSTIFIPVAASGFWGDDTFSPLNEQVRQAWAANPDYSSRRSVIYNHELLHRKDFRIWFDAAVNSLSALEANTYTSMEACEQDVSKTESDLIESKKTSDKESQNRWL